MTCPMTVSVLTLQQLFFLPLCVMFQTAPVGEIKMFKSLEKASEEMLKELG